MWWLIWSAVAFAGGECPQDDPAPFHYAYGALANAVLIGTSGAALWMISARPRPTDIPLWTRLALLVWATASLPMLCRLGASTYLFSTEDLPVMCGAPVFFELRPEVLTAAFERIRQGDARQALRSLATALGGALLASAALAWGLRGNLTSALPLFVGLMSWYSWGMAFFEDDVGRCPM